MKISEEKRSWLLLALIFAAWGFGYVDKQAINIATVAIREELGLSAGQMGMVMSSFFFSYSVMTLAGGFIAGKFGSKKSLVGIVFLWAIFSCLTGMVQSFVMLVAVRLLFGLSQGGFAAITSVAITELFPKELRGRAKTFQVSAGSMGIAFGALVCAASTVAFGWRTMFIIFGIIGFVIVFLLARFYRGRRVSSISADDEAGEYVSLKQVLKHGLVWKLAFIQFGLGVFIWGLNSWLPSYWLEVKQLDMMTMGTLSMIPWLVSFFLMNFSSWVIDKYFVRKERLALGSGVLIGAVFMWLMLQASGIYEAFSYLTLATVLMSIASAVVYMIPMKYMDKGAVGTATGVIIFGQQLAGVIAPAIMGYMITIFHGSYDAVFGFVIVMLIISSIVAFSVKAGGKTEEEINYVIKGQN